SSSPPAVKRIGNRSCRDVPAVSPDGTLVQNFLARWAARSSGGRRRGLLAMQSTAGVALGRGFAYNGRDRGPHPDDANEWLPAGGRHEIGSRRPAVEETETLGPGAGLARDWGVGLRGAGPTAVAAPVPARPKASRSAPIGLSRVRRQALRPGPGDPGSP